MNERKNRRKNEPRFQDVSCDVRPTFFIAPAPAFANAEQKVTGHHFSEHRDASGTNELHFARTQERIEMERIPGPKGKGDWRRWHKIKPKFNENEN